MATRFDAVRVREIMSRSLVCAAPDQELAEAEALLVEHRIGGLPVVEGGRLVGFVSRGDAARVQVLLGSLDSLVNDRLRQQEEIDGFEHMPQAEFRGFRSSLSGLKVRDAMHDQLATCTAEASVVDVAELMLRQHLHHVVVVEQDKPIGIVSSLDLLRLIAPTTAAGSGGKREP